MSFKLHSLFTTNVYQFQNPNAAQEHDSWRKALYGLRERDTGRVISNHLGWQSSVPLQTVPQLAGLARFILGCLNEVAQTEGWALERFNVIMEGWANINGKGASNNMHNHPNTLLSGAYYIDTPASSGEIVFRDPREAAHIFMPPYAKAGKSPVWKLTPQPGLLLVFPAWLLHAVEANLSDADRISIAFNANVEPRMGMRFS
jgi:uncharacterized protein (TIGR02466 family)